MDIKLNRSEPVAMSLKDLDPGDIFIFAILTKLNEEKIHIVSNYTSSEGIVCTRLYDGRAVFLSEGTQVRPLNDHLLTVEYK